MEKINNKLCLDISKFEYSPELFKIPHLHETWTWEGDESVLPYKWAEIISKSEIMQKQGREFDLESVKKYLKENYYGLDTFDKLSFFFITYRSKVMACSYFNTKTNTIDFFLINPKELNKGLENGLFSLIYKRVVCLKITKIFINIDNTNVSIEYFLNLGFKHGK